MTNYYQTRNQPHYQVVSYLTKLQKAKLKAHCATNNITMSSYIKTLILNNLDNTNSSSLREANEQ